MEVLADLEQESKVLLKKLYPQDMNPCEFAMCANSLWAKMVEKAGEISSSIHEENCPQNTTYMRQLAVGDCRCVNSPNIIKWRIATYLARVAYKVVSPANTFPESLLEMTDAYTKVLNEQMRIPNIRNNAELFELVVETISLLVPFATYIRKLLGK